MSAADRARLRGTFDEDAERYDRARPAYPPAMFEHLADLAGADAASSPVQAIAALTVREEQILATVARGRTNSEIAAELHISLSTVKTHIASLMAKLGARNRVEIAIWAYETTASRADPSAAALSTVARAASALLHIGRKCERAAGPSAGTDRAALPMCSCGVVTMLTSWTT
jgi:DNA-binding CsgD family transcriptional regulator